MFTGIATWIAKSVIGGWLTKIGAAVAWLFKAWYRIVIALLLAACIWCYVGWTSADNRAAKWKRTAEVEMALRISNEVAYKNAQAIAADMNRKQIETIQNRYKAIAEKSEILYEKRLTDSRAVVDKFMRSQAVKRPTEGTGTSGPAQVQPEVAGTGEMPIVPEGFILLPVNEAYMIAGAYDKLAALQDAAKETMAVDTNK